MNNTTYNCVQAVKKIKSSVDKKKHSLILSSLVDMGYLQIKDGKHCGHITRQQILQAIDKVNKIVV